MPRDGPKPQILTEAALSELFATAAEVVERGGYYQVRWWPILVTHIDDQRVKTDGIWLRLTAD